jgi:AcrR family transcriptional regulator
MSERLVNMLADPKIRDSALVAQRRAEIARAAIKVFKKKGFHLSTVRDIGEAAGLTQGTLYNYVRSKEDILFLVCDQLVQNYQSAAAAAIRNEPDPRKRLTAALRSIIATIEANQEDVLLLYQESHALKRDALHAVLQRVAEFIDGIQELLEEGRANGRLDFPDPKLAAEIITFLPLIVALRRWRLARFPERRSINDGLLEFMRLGLGIGPREAKGDSNA